MTPAARTPLLVVADDDPDERALIEAELQRRYGADYTVRICTTAELGAVLDEAEAKRRRRSRSRSHPGRREPTCSPACAAASRRRGAAS